MGTALRGRSTSQSVNQLPDYPITQLSNSPYGSNDDRAVLRSKAETIAERRVDVAASALVGNEVEIAGRIGIALVDCRRQIAARQRERRGDHAGGAARALRMPDHRLHRRSRKPLGVIAEQLPHA